MPTLKVYRARLPEHTGEQVDFFFLARGVRHTKVVAEQALLKRECRFWSQVYVVEADATLVEELLSDDVNNYIVGPVR